MNIITLSREFGSGGRELGKRLSDALGYAYYDREIITAIAAHSGMDPQYVDKTLTHSPLHFGTTFSYTAAVQNNVTRLLAAQHLVLKEIARQGTDCVIVGRSADVILKQYRPLNLFVYAEMDAKVRRCRERAPEGEQFSDRELIRNIKQVDANRARHRELVTSRTWQHREPYHLCINTSDLSIPDLAPLIAAYANFWFRSKDIHENTII